MYILYIFFDWQQEYYVWVAILCINQNVVKGCVMLIC